MKLSDIFFWLFFIVVELTPQLTIGINLIMKYTILQGEEDFNKSVFPIYLPSSFHLSSLSFLSSFLFLFLK